MTPAFTVRTTPHYERLARRLLQGDSEFRPSQDQAFEILRSDPYNRTRQHNIKKLTGVRRRDGQYRLRLGRWRFRSDIAGQEVVLHYCGLRREDTYRENLAILSCHRAAVHGRVLCSTEPSP
jgi:hypothetical protein